MEWNRNIMGKVRTSSVKVISRQIIKEYRSHLSHDSFEYNKDIVSKVAVVHSKRLRNRIAGYVTHQMKLAYLREMSYED
ncbi:MAG: 30S ribosomal protein S17e [Candidatus Hodarchaeota archaeon]